MLLGKRRRSPLPMRRTTSMKDGSAEDLPLPSDQDISATAGRNQQQKHRRVAEVWMFQRRWNGTDPTAEIVSPLGLRRCSGDFLAAELTNCRFLKDCALCNSHLLPARDIFMYRGEGFCSLKCRQQQINDDMRKEKLKLFLLWLKKKVSAQANSQSSNASGEGEETVTAA